MIEKFIVKHYHGDERPVIKGNSFDGLEIGEDREEAEEFIEFINNIINKNIYLGEVVKTFERAVAKLSCL